MTQPTQIPRHIMFRVDVGMLPDEFERLLSIAHQEGIGLSKYRTASKEDQRYAVRELLSATLQGDLAARAERYAIPWRSHHHVIDENYRLRDELERQHLEINRLRQQLGWEPLPPPPRR